MEEEVVLFFKEFIRVCIKAAFVKDENGNIDEDESAKRITDYILGAIKDL